MRAVWYEQQGAAHDVLHCGQMPTPVPAPGEVRVRLGASAVNPADANRRAGRLHLMEYPRIIPNSDGAGVIDAVGPGVNAARVGQRVWICFGQRSRPFGTAAEFICLAEDLACELPAHLSDEEGACLGIPCLTAYCALFGQGAIEGATVLVTGGAGAVGHYAIQLAKWGGARVIATASSRAKLAHATRAGADVVIDYTAPNALEQLRDAACSGVQRIVDVDAVANTDLVLGAAAEGATWVTYAIGAQATAALPMARIIRGNLRLQGLYLSGLHPSRRHEAQSGVCRWLADRPNAIHTVDSVHPLHETARAHQAVEAGTKVGTVVVSCGDAAPRH
ncbi:NADPH:quinone reductase [Variovorax sp. YR216]|uniref:NADPH:quinone reductase n=1 Tax=Variovorax sp. YR216 TaxID=1882828 RepID=UPI000896D6A8|nr:NADPH:quinone reductase [Variovorax sp. YR216]SEB22363.1 NADPH2:quinone reductase [Variovorax sp. YR216]